MRIDKLYYFVSQPLIEHNTNLDAARLFINKLSNELGLCRSEIFDILENKTRTKLFIESMGTLKNIDIDILRISCYSLL